MNIVALVILMALLFSVTGLLERNQRRTQDLSRSPHGLDREDYDLTRTRSEIEANRAHEVPQARAA